MHTSTCVHMHCLSWQEQRQQTPLPHQRHMLRSLQAAVKERWRVDGKWTQNPTITIRTRSIRRSERIYEYMHVFLYVCICMCMYACMNYFRYRQSWQRQDTLRIHTYMHTHTHVYYINTCMHVCLNACICIYLIWDTYIVSLLMNFVWYINWLEAYMFSVCW
jgi:hypothetical protein